jgi:signal transduction histidine kinase
MPRMAIAARPLVRRVPRLAGPAAGAFAVAVFMLTVAVSSPSYQSSPFEQILPDWLIGLGVATGAVLATASWVERDERPAVAIGLGVTSVALFVPIWAGWSWLPATAQAWALAVAPLAVAGAAQVGMRWSRGLRTSGTLRVVWGLTFAAAVIHAFGYDPLTDAGCTRTCAEAPPLAAGVISTPTTLAIVTSLVVLAAIVAAIGLVPNLMARRSGGIAMASLIAIGLLTLPWISRVVRPDSPPSPTDQILPGALAGLILGAAPLVATLRVRGVRAEMQQLVAQLSDAGATGTPVESSRQIAFAIPDDDRWVDAAGDPIEPELERGRSVVVADAAGPVLRLQLAQGDDPADVLAALTPAAMLALRNARLAAVSRARLAEVRASQRRIVATSDAERERIERDLHDGAQQRLVSAAFHLSLARNRLAVADGTATDTGLAGADAAVREALERLRALGHGIFPAVLTAEGLAAALEDLARDCEVPTTVDVPDLDLDRDVAAAAYAVVVAALATGAAEGASSAAISATIVDASLHIVARVCGDLGQANADYIDVADRVGALGGHFVVEPVEGGVQVRAEIPCA